ncbi:hypothetical protein HYX00_00620 [Candidatus Woesearchaeota archaeon]|nr:hypothetical protein [Candidatus Woesearchaeota archaeon]
MNAKIQSKSTKKIIEGEVSMMGDVVVLSPDLERRWRTMKKELPYTRSRLLVDINYKVNEAFVQRIGRIQFNAYDCIPLSLYAAIQSKH